MNLYLLPHAGGSSYSFNSMFSSGNFSPVALELPGHGRKISDPLLVDSDEASDALFASLPKGLNEPYAILGHSLGALLAFLVVRKIEQQGFRPPSHLFVSACCAPSLIVDKERRFLDSETFWMVIREMGGIGPEFIKDKSFRAVFEPILRADFKIMESYKYKASSPISCPITVMLGKDDDVTDHEAAAWARETSSEFTIDWFPGNHFYLFRQDNKIGEFISYHLSSTLSKKT